MQKILNFLKSKNFTLIASFLGLFLIATGVSVLVFSYLGKGGLASKTIGNNKNKSRINLSLPKTSECPMNGGMFTKAEEDVWKTRRPLGVMIENSLDARPQSGLSRADVVYEAVAEGGITRFLGIFYCNTVADLVKVAPVRSTRIYFVNLVAGYGKDPIYLHQGGANSFCQSCPGGVKPRGQIDRTVDAYAALDKLGWRNGQYGNDMDGGFNIGYPIVVRDQYRLGSEASAWEHSVVANVDEVYKEAEKRGFGSKTDFRIWKFEDGSASPNPQASNISFRFWDNWADYDVTWEFDPATNSYKRFNGGKAHTDWEFDKPQLTAKNVVIMFVKEKGPVDEEKHLYYEVMGTGKALIFKDGNIVEGTWKKSLQLDREVFYDKNGSEIRFTRGPIWIELVPSTNEVSY